MDTFVLDGSVASSVGRSSVEGATLFSSGEEVPNSAERVEKAVSIKKRRRSSIRKPRTKGLIKKLQEQIEFYFGDANLPKDKFLQQIIEEDPQGYVSVEVVAGFKRMRSLTTDRSLVLRAIKNSSLLEKSWPMREGVECMVELVKEVTQQGVHIMSYIL